MGGLDICYGRWDYNEHKLKDPGDYWDGADYNNYRLKDITQPRDYLHSNLNPNFQPRLPWHDIAIQFRGDVVLDLLRHFVQYWYFVKA
jgi:phospholipase D1/2